MVLHLGHFVQSPSGISRFLDFEASLGFLTNVVFPVAGGGVTAGSTVSKPSVFLFNAVVLIFIVPDNYSDSAGNCPDANFGRAGAEQHFGAGTGRGAGSENVIDQNNLLAREFRAVAHCESAADIGEPL